MISQTRVPQPVIIGEIDKSLLDGIRGTTTPGHILQNDYNPRSFREEISPEADDLVRFVQPIAVAALDDYQQYFMPATDARITLTIEGLEHRSSRSWHRDNLFPGEQIYIVSSGPSTEFAEGKGLPGLLKINDRIPINSLVKLLTSISLLTESEQIPDGTMVRFGSSHIHRTPAEVEEGRVTASVSLYNADFARDSLLGARWTRLKYRRMLEPAF